jgi:hypothetical protein
VNERGVGAPPAHAVASSGVAARTVAMASPTSCGASKRSRRPLRQLKRSRLLSSKSSPEIGSHRGFFVSLCLLLRGGCSVFFFSVFLCGVCENQNFQVKKKLSPRVKENAQRT